jgi:hypothetical protein
MGCLAAEIPTRSTIVRNAWDQKQATALQRWEGPVGLVEGLGIASAARENVSLLLSRSATFLARFIHRM